MKLIVILVVLIGCVCCCWWHHINIIIIITNTNTDIDIGWVAVDDVTIMLWMVSRTERRGRKQASKQGSRKKKRSVWPQHQKPKRPQNVCFSKEEGWLCKLQKGEWINAITPARRPPHISCLRTHNIFEFFFVWSINRESRDPPNTSYATSCMLLVWHERRCIRPFRSWLLLSVGPTFLL